MPPVPRQIVVAPVAAAALGLPAAASAQRSTIPKYGAAVSTRPPVPRAGADPRGEPSTKRPHTVSGSLMLLIAGSALALFGLGSRLRTADAVLR